MRDGRSPSEPGPDRPDHSGVVEVGHAGRQRGLEDVERRAAQRRVDAGVVRHADDISGLIPFMVKNVIINISTPVLMSPSGATKETVARISSRITSGLRAAT